ncbi:tRNA lysidine(34) synthetase TilS [Noviherbaspirillum galbum]|uniref:tRNA(Ile)-lysidine synthase n=1 Tax=Noviherbaspirillum galbum TaxID=2709383 RepID=A0A6B3SW88_9BURK|nr:tRNA lysidine(34) synthetase TilS [Noviherbaspirillum galbum]NEX62642.1 tRNA lysidine(34) synthetase TilS [Noviherbaspirillum galbum]
MPTAALTDTLERALDLILARVFISAPAPGTRIALAYSGGLDSSVLLDLLAPSARRRNLTLLAFHVHHGLSADANAWLNHCERECALRQVEFDCRRIRLDGKGEGIEQAARKGRYAALGEMCRQHDVPLLLTAHHLDDQAETVLLQLFRGTGIAGLAGMEDCNTAPSLLGTPSPHVGRPLLAVTRAELESHAAARQLRHVDDASNRDTRFARNALRGTIMPALGQAFPGFQQRVARAALHAASAQRLLQELGAQDLAACGDKLSLDLEKVRRLSQDRIDNVFRHWFAVAGLRMPSSAWLKEMQLQLFEADVDAQLRVTHPDAEVHRYRGKVYLAPRCASGGQVREVRFQWDGGGVLVFPDYGGTLHFLEGEQGIDRNWLLENALVLRPRGPGDKLKPASNRPTRSLKLHYQALGIPPWQREHLPVAATPAGKLVFAAGVGCDSRHAPPGKVVLRWHSEIFPS